MATSDTPPTDGTAKQPARRGFVRCWSASAEWAVALFLCTGLGLLATKGLVFYSKHKQKDLQTPALDINTASPSALMQLPSVGPKLAEEIVAHRPFTKFEELDDVPGIGPVTLEAIRPYVYVDPNTAKDAKVIAAKPAFQQRRPAGNKQKIKAEAERRIVNVNTATAQELDQNLPGIGPVLAGRIIAERKNGLFATLDDLTRVSGIGPKRLERLRPFATVR